MELLRGPSLAGLLASRGPLPVELALRYAEQAAGLAAAHAAGVIHRDVKPGNLVLADDGTLSRTPATPAVIQSASQPKPSPARSHRHRVNTPGTAVHAATARLPARAARRSPRARILLGGARPRRVRTCPRPPAVTACLA